MKKSNIKNTLNEMDNLMKIINESYVFDDDTSSYDENEMIDEYPEEDISQLQSDDKISQIRSIALDGIQEYADDVDSEEYDFFKKIWLMCDKVCSDKDSTKESNE